MAENLDLSFLNEEGQNKKESPANNAGDLLDVSFLGSPQQPIVEEDWGTVLGKTMQNLPERFQLGVNATIQDLRDRYSNATDATNEASAIKRRLDQNPEDQQARELAQMAGVNPDSLIGDPRTTTESFNQLTEFIRKEKVKSDPEIQKLVDEAAELQQTLQENAPRTEKWSAKGIVSAILGSGVEMAPAILTTLVTRSPMTGSGVMAAQVYGQSLAEGNQMGLTREQARNRAAVNTVAEFATQGIPLGQLVKRGSNMVEGAVKAGISEGIQESATQAINMGYDAGVLNEEMTIEQALEELAYAGIVGAGVGAPMGALTTPFREPLPEEPLDRMVAKTAGTQAAQPDQDALSSVMQQNEALSQGIEQDRLDRMMQPGIEEVPSRLDKFRRQATQFPGEKPDLGRVEQTIAEADVGLSALDEELAKTESFFASLQEPEAPAPTTKERREKLYEGLERQRVVGGIGEVQQRLSRPASPSPEELIRRAPEEAGPTPGELEFRRQQDAEYLAEQREAKIPETLREHEQGSKLRNKGYRKALEDYKGLAEKTTRTTKLNPAVDTISEAAGKLGGLSREAASSEGFDEAGFKRSKVFPAKGGRTFDEMAELLNERGYRNREGGTLDANDVVDLVSSEVNNQETFFSTEADLDMLTEDAAAVREWSRELGGSEKLQTAIDKAMRGEKLGTKQTQVIGEMLDTINAIRQGEVEGAIETLQARRDERRSKEADEFNSIVQEATGRKDFESSFDEYSDLMATLPEEADIVDGAFVEIANKAADQNFDATDAVLERLENGEINTDQAVDELNNIIEGQVDEQVETAVEEERPEAVEPVSETAVAEQEAEPVTDPDQAAIDLHASKSTGVSDLSWENLPPSIRDYWREQAGIDAREAEPEQITETPEKTEQIQEVAEEAEPEPAPEVIEPEPEIAEEAVTEEYTFDFGKHKGKTLTEVADESPDYIEWIKGKKGFKRTKPDLIEAINKLEGQEDVPSTTRDLEPDTTDAADTLDQGLSEDQRRERAREVSDEVTEDLENSRTELPESSGIPIDSSLDVGAQEPDTVAKLDEQPSDEIGVTGDVDSRGSANDGDERLSVDSPRVKEILEEAKQRHSDTRSAKQAEADKIKVVYNDAQNITDTLPLLSPEQISDVINAERRLYGENEKGILFTNGTGTGKTYTGTGVAKRAVQDGKKVLVIAPNGTIAGWQGAAKDLGFEYAKIKNKATGAGDNPASITTYQNFADNPELMQEHFDLVIYDESHKLMANMQGDTTKATSAHFALTNKEGKSRGSQVLAKDFASLRSDIKKYAKDNNKSEAETYEIPKFKRRQNALLRKKNQIDKKALQAEKKSPTKALFLSATPFSGHKSVFYGDGYLFNTDDGYKQQGGYNSGNAEQQFLVKNFGYRMKYNKANTPGPEVDVGLLERDWADQMFDSGAMVGRVLNLPYDYSREFVVVEKGVGGKDADRNTNEVTEYDRAKTYYFKRQARTAATKAQEGTDYFATPEPIGLSMVKLSKLLPGEKAMEPSAGHGAIARWLPDSTTNVMVEQSPQLIGELSLVSEGDVKNMDFEDLNVINKFDVVVMNPPFGSGGSQAIKHIDKATKHLNDGGRVVAIYPEGPAADKKFDKWYEESDGIYLTGEINLPSVTFSRAGTKVGTRILVLDKDVKGGNVFDGQINQDLSNIEDINELFDRMEAIEAIPRPDVSISGEEVGLNTEEKDGKFIAELNEFRTSGKARQLGKRELKKLAEKYFGEVVNTRDYWEKTTYTFENNAERNKFFKAILEETQPKKGQLAKLVKEPVKGLPSEAVQKEVDKFVKEYAGVAPVTIAVTGSQDAVPVSLKPGEKVKALYNPADVSLVMVAENFNSAEEVQQTLRHELVVHYGLRALMGRDRYNMHMDRLLRSNDKKLKAVMDEVRSTYQGYIDLDSKSGQRILAEEALAHIAETDLKVGPIRRFINAVLKALKTVKLIPDTATYTDAVDLIRSNAQGLRSRAVDKTQVRVEDVETTFDQNPYLASLYNDATVENAPVSDAIKESIRKAHYTGDNRSFVQRVKDALSINMTAARQGLIDQFESIKMYEIEKYGEVQSAENSAYKQASLSTDTNAIVETALKHGVPKYDGGTVKMREGVKPLQEIIAQVTDLDPDLLPVWTHWLAAKRVKDQKLIEQGKEKLFTKEMLNEIFAEIDSKPEIKAVFEQAQKDYAAFNKATLDFAQDAGLVDPSQRQMWEDDSYVPFYRITEEAQKSGPFGKKGIEGQSAGIRALKGGTDKLNILESMVQNPMHLIGASYKNLAMQKVVDTTEGLAMNKVPMGWKPVQVDNAQIAKALREIGIEFDDLTSEEKKRYSTLFQMNAPQGDNIVSVMVDGKREYYEVSDPLLVDAVTALGPQPVNEIVKLLGVPKRLLTNMVTSTPPFMVRNFIRDVVSNYVQADKATGTDVKQTVLDATLMRPFGRSLKGMKASIAEDTDRWTIMAAGGMSGEYFGSNTEDVTKDIVKPTKAGFSRAATSLFRGYKHVVRASEEATRIAVFRQVKENGGTDMEAAYQAKNVLNFSRHGQYKVIEFLIGTVPFFNARVQGLDRLYQGAKANPASFALRGAMLTAATFALMAMNDDREEYWALPEHERDTYWHVWVDGVHIRIPKPFEAGAMFATIPERVYEAATREEKVFLSRMGSMFMDTFSMNPIPQAFSPIVEQVANRSFFMDRPIVSMALENLTPELQFTNRTSEIAKYMARMMPDFMPEWARSPVRIEHIINSYFGTVGGYVLSTGDYMAKTMTDTPVSPEKRVTDYPLIKDFIRDGERSTKYVGRFYDMVTQASKINRSIKDLEAQERFDEAREQKEKYGSILQIRRRLNRTRKRLTDINAQMKRIYRNRTMTPEAKRNKLEQLTRKKNELTKEISEKYWKLF